MPSLDTALIVLAGIALFAAFVNGAIGYGFSSLTVPVALVFYTNRILNPAVVVIEVFVNLYVLFINLSGVPAVWKRVFPILVGLLPGIAVGAFVLALLEPGWIKFGTYVHALTWYSDVRGERCKRTAMPSILVCCGAVIALLGLPTFAQAQTPPPLQPEILRVSNAADTGEGSLRWAIERSNSAPGHYRIEIDLPGQAPFVIKPASPLPPIKGPVEIEGMAWKRSGDFTAIDGSGYIENKGMQTCPGATPGQYGANVRTLTNPGLTLIDTEGIDISGLEIRYFCIGILIHRSSGNTIHDNHIIGNRGGAGIMLTGDDGNGNSTATTTRYNKIIRNESVSAFWFENSL
jgi:parallel beta-helix repeat protein